MVSYVCGDCDYDYSIFGESNDSPVLYLTDMNEIERILAAIAHEMGYMLSYGVFSPGQYIFSHYRPKDETLNIVLPTNDNEEKTLWYCAVRVRDSVLTLVLTNEQYRNLDLSNPDSLDELRDYLNVVTNWYPAGQGTELKILTYRRDEAALQELLASLDES